MCKNHCGISLILTFARQAYKHTILFNMTMIMNVLFDINSMNIYVLCVIILSLKHAILIDFQIELAENEDDLRNTMQTAEWRYEIPGLPTIIKMDQRHIFVKEVTLYMSVLRSQGMIDQFIQGLNYYDVSFYSICLKQVNKCSACQHINTKWRE